CLDGESARAHACQAQRFRIVLAAGGAMRASDHAQPRAERGVLVGCERNECVCGADGLRVGAARLGRTLAAAGCARCGSAYAGTADNRIEGVVGALFAALPTLFAHLPRVLARLPGRDFGALGHVHHEADVVSARERTNALFACGYEARANPLLVDFFADAIGLLGRAEGGL